jgi:hypothetical protein
VVAQGGQAGSEFHNDNEFQDEDDAPAQRQCPTCSRKFNPQPYEKHVKVCAKVFLQRRTAFDTSKQRAEGTELAEVQRHARAPEKKKKKAAGGGGGGEAASKKAKWKAESEMFRAAMRAGRASSSSAPPSHEPSAPDPSLVPCPACGRTFSESAAERHIPQCRDRLRRAKPAGPLKKGSGGGAGGKRRSTIL